jgi:hypothetical protein
MYNNKKDTSRKEKNQHFKTLAITALLLVCGVVAIKERVVECSKDVTRLYINNTKMNKLENRQTQMRQMENTEG